MTLQELIDKKKELGLTVEMIAQRSGVPLGTVQKIFAGITKTPRYDTLIALEHALMQEELRRRYIEQEHLPANYFDDINNMPPAMVRESQAAETLAQNWEVYASASGSINEIAGKKQGSYTIEDYYALPDDRRVELIDGVIYDMGAPTARHQAIIGFLFNQFFNCAVRHGHSCRPFISPIDVRILQDDRNMFQPDMIVLCGEEENDERLADGRRVEGAPDFVLEVLSPSTRKRDMFLKCAKYMEAGVREYWLIDPDRETVTVYGFETEEVPVTYFFDCVVPVRISNGDLAIDLKQLKDYLTTIHM